MAAIAETIEPLSHRVRYFVVWPMARFWIFGRLVCTGYSVPTVITRAGIDAVVRGREIYGKSNGVEGYIDASGATSVVGFGNCQNVWTGHYTHGVSWDAFADC